MKKKALFGFLLVLAVLLGFFSEKRGFKVNKTVGWAWDSSNILWWLSWIFIVLVLVLLVWAVYSVFKFLLLKLKFSKD